MNQGKYKDTHEILFPLHSPRDRSDLGIRMFSPGPSPQVLFCRLFTRNLMVIFDYPGFGLIKLAPPMRIPSFPLKKVYAIHTMVNMQRQECVSPENVNPSVWIASKPPSPRVSTTHPNRLGTRSVARRFWRLSTFSQHSLHHHLEVFSQRSHQRRSRSLESDANELAKAHAK